MERRKIMKKVIALALCGILLLGGCSTGGGGTGKNEEKKLVLSTFGLSEDISEEDIYKPFEDAFGCTIITETGTGSERYTKFASNPDSSIDLIELSQSYTADGVAAGLFEAVDFSKIENYENLLPAAKTIADETGGAAYVINSIGIIYDPEAVGVEINDFSDLWDESLKGKIAIPDITTTFGPAIVYVASDYKGVDIKSDNGAAAFEALEELKPNIVKTYSKSSDLINMFTAGEITAAIVGDYGVPTIKQANPNLEYIAPAGTYANFNVICVNKNSNNKELAYEYINYRLSAELQKKTAGLLNEAPTNSLVELTEEEAANLTYGEVAENAKSVDYTFVNPILSDWIDQWNRIINS